MLHLLRAAKGLGVQHGHRLMVLGLGALDLDNQVGDHLLLLVLLLGEALEPLGRPQQLLLD
eukprot:5385262-Pyramimonas_sp.AAC.1